MSFYIRIVNGQPVDHPLTEENLIAVIPDIDLDNLPSEYAKFERVENPRIAPIGKVDDHSYQWVDGIVKDVWFVRDMTSEEKAKAAETAHKNWNKLPDRDNFTAWTYNENTFWFDPPTPRPETGTYFWQGTTSSWVERPQRPDDGKVYKLDFASATWVEVPQP